MVFQIFIQKNDNQFYEVKNFSDFSIAKNTPVSPMPLPEEDSADNMLIKIEGNSTTVGLTWSLVQDNGTVVGGTGIIWNPSISRFEIDAEDTSIKTPFEQLRYLELFVPNSLSDFYRIWLYDTDKYNQGLSFDQYTYYLDGLIQDINFRISGDSPVVWTATLNFIQGTVISTLSGNTAEAPTLNSGSIIVTNNQRTGITATFQEYQYYASSNDRPVTTGAVLRYKVDSPTSFWQEKEITFSQSASPFSYTQNFTSLDLDQDTNKDYRIKISIITDGGRGEWSNEITVT